MTASRRAPPRTPLDRQRSELARLLADLRTASGLTLRQVEEATEHAVSNAYLSQLEKGKVGKPSPSVLHSLATVYRVSYEALMEKAGYLPSKERVHKRRRRAATFALADLSGDEEAALMKYLAFIRFRKSS